MKNIVLIDDEKDIVDTLTNTLNTIKTYNIISFTNSKKALNYINNNQEKINLIITDILMPHMNGIDLIKNANDINNIPLLFLSGVGEDGKIINQAYELNNKVLTINYMVKPFNLFILINTIKTLLNNQQFHLRCSFHHHQIENIYHKISENNKDLKKEIKKIIFDYSDFGDTYNKTREIIKNIFSNDLPLIKFISKVIEKNRDTLAAIIGEGEEMFKLLPKLVEPIHTVIADITSIFQMLVYFGVLNKNDIEPVDIEKSTFYNMLYDLYRNGGFDAETFKELIDMIKVNNDDKNDEDIILF